MKNKIYGWRPDVPDQRDLLYSPEGLGNQWPPHVDLRAQCPPVYDQGQLGSCTANAIAGAMQFVREKEKLADFTPSRLFIYYNERAMEGTIDSDSGAQIRDGIKSVATLGVCPESFWPYHIVKFKFKPSDKCFQAALATKAVKYQRVLRHPDHFYACLAAGFPFVLGISVYESFESERVAATGQVLLPTPHERLLGGHAVLCVGYDANEEFFICRNSWGSQWGSAGYFTLPLEYLLDPNLSDDFWTVRLV